MRVLWEVSSEKHLSGRIRLEKNQTGKRSSRENVLPAHYSLVHTRPVWCQPTGAWPGAPALGYWLLLQIPLMPSAPAAGQALGRTPCGCLLAAAAPINQPSNY